MVKFTGKRLYVFYDLCSGCRLCEIICSFVTAGEFNPSKSHIKVVKVDEEGFSMPVIDCDGQTCLNLGFAAPRCADLCPSGCIVFTEPGDFVQKVEELIRARREQPIFKEIATWKWPYPWRPWR